MRARLALFDLAISLLSNLEPDSREILARIPFSYDQTYSNVLPLKFLHLLHQQLIALADRLNSAGLLDQFLFEVNKVGLFAFAE